MKIEISRFVERNQLRRNLGFDSSSPISALDGTNEGNEKENF